MTTPKIKVRVSNTGQIISTNPVTVSSSIPASAASRLDALRDVDSDGEVDGAVPVYQANTDTYIVKKLDITNVSGSANIDGGTF